MSIWLPNWLYSSYPGICYSVSGAVCVLGTTLSWILATGLFVYATYVLGMRRAWV